MFLENSIDNVIQVIIQAPYQIGDVSGHLATLYSIDGKTKIPIGCSHLCINDEAYLLERRVVGARIGDLNF